MPASVRRRWGATCGWNMAATPHVAARMDLTPALGSPGEQWHLVVSCSLPQPGRRLRRGPDQNLLDVDRSRCDLVNPGEVDVQSLAGAQNAGPRHWAASQPDRSFEKVQKGYTRDAQWRIVWNC